MEATIVCWVYFGIMKTQMETTIYGLRMSWPAALDAKETTTESNPFVQAGGGE